MDSVDNSNELSTDTTVAWTTLRRCPHTHNHDGDLLTIKRIMSNPELEIAVQERCRS